MGHHSQLLHQPSQFRGGPLRQCIDLLPCIGHHLADRSGGTLHCLQGLLGTAQSGTGVGGQRRQLPGRPLGLCRQVRQLGG